MARHEEDREDLFEEFRSAIQKWEIQTSDHPKPVICGFRKDGRFSIYYDQDHCYHFNLDYQLQRAYQAGALYRTQGTTLAKLTRTRTEAETILNRIDLDESGLTEFLDELKERLKALFLDLKSQKYEILRSEPMGITISEFRKTLDRLCQHDIQLAPAYATRRT